MRRRSDGMEAPPQKASRKSTLPRRERRGAIAARIRGGGEIQAALAALHGLASGPGAAIVETPALAIGAMCARERRKRRVFCCAAFLAVRLV